MRIDAQDYPEGESHIFLLRLWEEPDRASGAGWQMRVQHLFTGEACTATAPAQTGLEMLALLLGLARGEDPTPPSTT